jgi:hypothetical protein
VVSVVIRSATVMFGACAVPCLCLAQAVRVSVRDSAAGVPIARALVTAQQENSNRAVHGLTNDSGEVTMRLPSAGRWTVAMRRIGIEPRSSAPHVVSDGELAVVRFLTHAARFRLPVARVIAARGGCFRTGENHDRTSALWEQVTLALRASVVAEADRARASGALLRTVTYDRELDRGLRLVSENVVQVRRGTGRPFAALDPDSLAIHGYVRADAERTLLYFAPDEQAFLSESFVATHCFDAPASDTSASIAELHFRPDPSRGTPDIAGTAFVDATSGALQRITFRFVNADSLFPSGTAHAGGDVHFSRLSSGEWFAAAWSIRMPRMIRVSWARGPRLTGYHEVGGSVDTLANFAERGHERAPRLVDTPIVQRDQSASDTSQNVNSGDRVIVAGRLYAAAPPQLKKGVDWRRDFAERRRFGVGVFLDSAALAPAPSSSAVSVFNRLDGVRLFAVPDGVPAPPRDEDIDLAEAWAPGSLLPMMRPSVDGGTDGECLVKLFLDGARVSAVILRSVAADSIVALEYYARPRDVPSGFRRSGNACGTAMLWSRSSGDSASVR